MSTKTTAKKRKAAATRANQAIGWTRGEFSTRANEILGSLMILWHEARFAHQNGYPRPVRGLIAAFDERLPLGIMELLTHLVRRSFERRLAFETVIEEMSTMDGAVRAHLNAEFTRVYVKVTRPLDERDTEGFWMRVRQAARVLGAAGERSP
jgi:hypothetical protein